MSIGSQGEYNGQLLTLTEDSWRAEVKHSMHRRCKEFFDACANGTLLLISPWEFENGRKHLARWQCLFLNDIAMQLPPEWPQQHDITESFCASTPWARRSIIKK